MSITEKNAVSKNHTNVQALQLENSLLPAHLKEILLKSEGEQEVAYSNRQVSRFLDACCDCV